MNLHRRGATNTSKSEKAKATVIFLGQFAIIIVTVIVQVLCCSEQARSKAG